MLGRLARCVVCESVSVCVHVPACVSDADASVVEVFSRLDRQDTPRWMAAR